MREQYIWLLDLLLMLEICIGITILIKYQVCEFVVVYIIKAVNPYMYVHVWG